MSEFMKEADRQDTSIGRYVYEFKEVMSEPGIGKAFISPIAKDNRDLMVSLRVIAGTKVLAQLKNATVGRSIDFLCVLHEYPATGI